MRIENTNTSTYKYVTFKNTGETVKMESLLNKSNIVNENELSHEASEIYKEIKSLLKNTNYDVLLTNNAVAQFNGLISTFDNDSISKKEFHISKNLLEKMTNDKDLKSKVLNNLNRQAEIETSKNILKPTSPYKIQLGNHFKNNFINFGNAHNTKTLISKYSSSFMYI